MYPIKLKAHERNVNIVRLNYDGDLVFSGGPGDKQNPSINVFNSFTGELLGSYITRAAIKSLDVDIDSNFLICVSFDGTLQMFEVKTGKSLFWVNFPLCKGYHVEFALGSKKFLFLHDFQMNSMIKVMDFLHFSKLQAQPDSDGKVDSKNVKILNDFPIFYEKGVDQCRSEKAIWFADNKSIFLGTNKGEVLHFSETGEQLNRAIIHKDNKIKALAFSADFSILATAGTDGCKIIDPATLQILHYFKQEHPMNAVSVSPLFCHPVAPKYHVIMGGGIPAIQAAGSKAAGFEAHVCNVRDGVEIGKLSTHFGPINSVEFMKDGRGYITGSEDSFVVIVRFDESYFDNPKYE